MFCRSTVVLGFVLLGIDSFSAATFSGEILFGEQGGLEVWAIPQPAPAPGFLATRVELRTTDPDGSIVTYTNIRIEGRVHQTWLDGPFGQPTRDQAFVRPSALYGEGWAALDTHLLMSADMMGGCAGPGYVGISESNDGSSTAHEFLSPIAGTQFGAKTGYGDLSMQTEFDACFFDPEFQRSEIPWAYVVTDNDPEMGPGEVYLTFGILGIGIIDAGEPGGAHFGYNGQSRLQVPFQIPEPCFASLSTLVWLCLFVAESVRARSRRTKLLLH